MNEREPAFQVGDLVWFPDIGVCRVMRTWPFYTDGFDIRVKDARNVQYYTYESSGRKLDDAEASERVRRQKWEAARRRLKCSRN
jgi:hypothetical protein